MARVSVHQGGGGPVVQFNLQVVAFNGRLRLSFVRVNTAVGGVRFVVRDFRDLRFALVDHARRASLRHLLSESLDVLGAGK